MKKLIFIFEVILFIVIDQISKCIVYLNRDNLPITIIKNLFCISYCENTGIAFGILRGKITMIAIVTIILMIAILFIIKSNFNNIDRKTLLGLGLVISGGIGNFIDRLVRGYVIDFLDFSNIFNFPIFNFADICIVLGVILIGITYLILDRGENIEDNCSR